MTWAETAVVWLREHPGWHKTREIAEAIGYPHPRSFAQVLAQAQGLERHLNTLLFGDDWRLPSPPSAPPETS